ncbi:CDF family cobalt/cadmium/zinc transporter [Streptomyces zinciresistens K42]|uniref:CDF family cobalt/cadmium/zinc transporter n=1 Tax=Streptomyces zinciresistens K42 TaxID=700597 RepID=G2GEW5_9ACTN|nr:hypothetical protein [Streptomyces zinciresistens]EGX57974.1 CDF family cobalt/cadmium/zinc transporter [Streptomyces zinciresistens K42]
MSGHGHSQGTGTPASGQHRWRLAVSFTIISTDLHLWTLTSGMHVATAHLVTSDGYDGQAVLDRAGELLREGHGFAHGTLRVEATGRTGCDRVGW